MNITSWFKLFGTVPAVRDSVNAVATKDWTASKSIWYQIIKTLVTVLAALGLYGVMSEQEIETISTGLAIVVPVVCTMFDAAAAIWLRFRTSRAIAKKVTADDLLGPG